MAVGTHLHVVEKNYSVTLTGNNATLNSNTGGKGYGVIYVDCGGSSRTGAILESGVEAGQIIRVINVSDGAETITFAASATSHVAGSVVIARDEGVHFVWSAALGEWVPTIGADTIGDGTVTTAKLDDAAVTSAKIDSSVIQTVEVELTATEIVGTSAGDLGHAAGAVLVAAEADVVHEFISAVLVYEFDTAAYTGGGDDLVIRQGTTAVGAAITSANLLGAAGDKVYQSTAIAAALTANSTLNIKSTAWTQPGTAAGVLRVRLTYRSHPAALA